MSATLDPARRGGCQPLPSSLPSWTASIALTALVSLGGTPSMACVDIDPSDVSAPTVVDEASSKPTPAGPLTDAPVDRWRTELLEYAFDAATLIPLHPHLKDRTKAQSDVVSAALAAEQPLLAIKFANPIANWRRGDSYAAIAFWSARRGYEGEARRLLEIATSDMKREEEEWRRDRVRAAIARTYALLGEDDAVIRLEEGMLPHEVGKSATGRTAVADDDDFDLLMEWAERTVALNSFDPTRNAIDVLLGLQDRFYADKERRTRTEETIRGSWQAVPLVVRLDVLKRFVELANAHGDRERALAIAEEARNVMTSNPWLPEDEIAMGARLGALLHAAGDTSGAESILVRSELLYQDSEERIGKVFRATALRALAEGWAACGDHDMARRIYGRAVEVALDNRNARPRAEDLSAIAASMAERGVEPDADLLARLLEALDGLVAPW